MDIGGICIFIVFYRYFYSVVREWLYSAFLALNLVSVLVLVSVFVSALVILCLFW